MRGLSCGVKKKGTRKLASKPLKPKLELVGKDDSLGKTAGNVLKVTKDELMGINVDVSTDGTNLKSG